MNRAEHHGADPAGGRADGAGRDATIRLNGEERPWVESDLAGWLQRAGIEEARRGIAVAVNGRVVPRREWAGCAIAPGDEIEIVGAVAGG